jgi:hypothetical protein
MSEISVPSEVRQEINRQRMRLADITLPANVDALAKAKLGAAIQESFVSGFRRVALGSAMLALLSAVSAFWLIEGKTVTKKSAR